MTNTQRTAGQPFAIGAKHLRTIYGAAREHGISNDELHDVIAEWGHISLKELSQSEYYKLLDGIRGRREASGSMAFSEEAKWAMGNHGRKDVAIAVEVLATARDVQLIRECAALRGWDEGTLLRFIERQIKKPRITTKAEMNKVLWGLKSMNRRDRLFV